MKPLDVIKGLRVASPCSMSWGAMEGDDRARFCGACEKYVYNIAALTTPEVVDLIRESQGEFCGRIYRRRDGSVITGDCPVGVRASASRRIRRLMTLVVVGAGLAMAAMAPRSRPRPVAPPEGSGVSFGDWSDWARRTLGFGGTTTGGAVLGEIPAVAGGIRAMPPPAVAPTAGDGTP